MCHFILAAWILLGAPSEPAIPRLNPSAFHSLPSVVRETLRARRCLIPQPWPYRSPDNIVAGHFRSRNRTDYAALCSRNGFSTVLVVSGRTGAILANLNRQPDSLYVQSVLDGTMGFSRRLDRVPPSPRGFCLELNGPCPCRGTAFDGIEDLFEGKASETHCWRKGWHTVVSGD